MGDPGERVFYRIIQTATSSLGDFRSDAARGKPPPLDDDPLRHRMWRGPSAHRTEAQARKKARGVGIGNFIAESIIPAERAISVEPTLKSSGHHTLWGDPNAILACVRRVVAVSEDD